MYNDGTKVRTLSPNLGSRNMACTSQDIVELLLKYLLINLQVLLLHCGCVSRACKRTNCNVSNLFLSVAVVRPGE